MTSLDYVKFRPLYKIGGLWDGTAGSLWLIHSRRKTPIFKSGYKAPLSINHGYTPGLAWQVLWFL